MDSQGGRSINTVPVPTSVPVPKPVRTDIMIGIQLNTCILNDLVVFIDFIVVALIDATRGQRRGAVGTSMGCILL
jgi:hypothetical protein